MRGKLRSYFYWKSSIGKMQRALRKSGGKGGGGGGGGANKGASGNGSGSAAGTENAALKRKAEWQRGQAPSGKRRRVRGGGNVNVGKVEKPVGADADALAKESGEMADM